MSNSLNEFVKILEQAKELGITVTVNGDETLSLSTKNSVFSYISDCSCALVFLKGIEHGMRLANHPEELVRD
jgi:hypothetical protein